MRLTLEFDTTAEGYTPETLLRLASALAGVSFDPRVATPDTLAPELPPSTRGRPRKTPAPDPVYVAPVDAGSPEEPDTIEVAVDDATAYDATGANAMDDVTVYDATWENAMDDVTMDDVTMGDATTLDDAPAERTRAENEAIIRPAAVELGVIWLRENILDRYKVKRLSEMTDAQARAAAEAIPEALASAAGGGVVVTEQMRAAAAAAYRLARAAEGAAS
jgi:hypothetical protein